MENVKKMARSHSVKMTELLRLQSKVEAEGEGEAGEAEAGAEDTELPTKLPILRVAGHEGTKQQRRERERENRQLANGSASPAGGGGKICYEDVVHLLTCPCCGAAVSAPVSQCRRGHLSCGECARARDCCSLCRGPWLDTPNITLDKIISLIALPCKYGSQGCPVVRFQAERLQHQTVCEFRPVHCQFSSHGCGLVLAVKDLAWHHKQCSYAALSADMKQLDPDTLLPDMPPSRKKSSVKVKNGIK